MRHEIVGASEPEPTEPALIAEVFINGILPIEDCGEVIRVTGYADRKVGGLVERIIVARLVLARHAFEEALALATKSAPSRPTLVKR